MEKTDKKSKPKILIDIDYVVICGTIIVLSFTQSLEEPFLPPGFASEIRRPAPVRGAEGPRWSAPDSWRPWWPAATRSGRGFAQSPAPIPRSAAKMPSVGRWLHWCPKVVEATCGWKGTPWNLKILEDLIYISCVTVINLLEYLESYPRRWPFYHVLSIFPGAQVPAPIFGFRPSVNNGRECTCNRGIAMPQVSSHASSVYI